MMGMNIHVILVYDVSSRESFEALDTWWKEVNTYCSSPDVVKMIVGNKVDKVILFKWTRYCCMLIVLAAGIFSSSDLQGRS